ncbi:MAG TPA: phage minor head protein [Mycobacterium sp.]
MCPERALELVEEFVAKQTPGGEKFNASYFDDERDFRDLIRAQRRLERAMKTAQREQAGRRHALVSMAAVRRALAGGSLDLDRLLQASAWNEEDAHWVKHLVSPLRDAAELGIRTQFRRMFKDQWKRLVRKQLEDPAEVETEASAFARANAGSQAKGLNRTTRHRIGAAVADGIESGESVAQIADRIDRILGDARRARMIAQTEVIRAYNHGLYLTAKHSGLSDRKQWLGGQADDFCLDLDGEIVGIDDNFSTGDSQPPLHPRCRCALAFLPSTGSDAPFGADGFDEEVL